MSPDERNAFAALLKSFREQAGLTMGQLSEDSGVSKGYLSQLESGGASNPSVEALRKLAKALGVSVVDLLGEAERESPAEGRRLPAGLVAFVEDEKQRGEAITSDDVDALLGIRFRGRRPETKEDFAFLWEMLRRMLG